MNESSRKVGNVLESIELSNSRNRDFKIDIVIEIRRIFEARGLTQTAAAELAGLARPDLSNILRGQLKGYSVERLLRVLTALGQDVEIVVRPGKGTNKPAIVTVKSAR